MIADTPEAIELFRLITLKSALKLQSKGISVHRGVNPRKLAKEATGLKTNDFEKLIAAVEELIVIKGSNPAAKFKEV